MDRGQLEAVINPPLANNTTREYSRTLSREVESAGLTRGRALPSGGSTAGRAMAQYRANEEQPGLEVAPGRDAEAPQVFYEQGLEFNAAQHKANLGHYNTQPYGQQYGPPPQLDPYNRQSYQTSTSPSFSYLTPASDGKIPFDGTPPVGTENSPGAEHVSLKIGKRKLWLILGVLATVLVLGLSLGLGLGLGLSQSGDGSSSDSSPSSTPKPSSTSVPESSISCPTSNRTTFTSEISPAEFDIYCGIDYNGNADANTKDLAHIETARAEDCINMCASNESCVGAGWGWYQPDSSVAGSDVCWLKSKLGTSHTAIQDWVFVIKQ
ncbi:hypothetical protein DHEL01_v205867 [Diaporthe helianthi]|uniref:Apple domain-containing protein n=1 Tax=Diaporthe helianthi TaxID=158607 RepID=A0A2P5HZS5_DIAHE|nr:hypothetical protein DHEL01_v205867 [Diaporthe helianthi]